VRVVVDGRQDGDPRAGDPQRCAAEQDLEVRGSRHHPSLAHFLEPIKRPFRFRSTVPPRRPLTK
jgi:hypothetical protein